MHGCASNTYKPLFVGVCGCVKTVLFPRLTRDRIKTDRINN